MRVPLTLASLSGAISASTALLPVVASDFLSVNGAEPLDPIDLVVEPQASALQATLPPAEVNPVVAPPASTPEAEVECRARGGESHHRRGQLVRLRFYCNRTVNGVEPLDSLDLVVEPQGPELQKIHSPAAVKPVLAPPSSELPKPKLTVVPEVVKVITGEASWYGPGFYGNLTANGEVYKPGTMTAAHRTLPFGTKVRITNLWNGRTAVIRINDRGPFIDQRVIDLGHDAASYLGLTASGIAQVKLEVLR